MGLFLSMFGISSHANLTDPAQEEEANWNFAVTLPDRGDEIDKTTVKGSQFQKPYLEFSDLFKHLDLS